MPLILVSAVALIVLMAYGALILSLVRGWRRNGTNRHNALTEWPFVSIVVAFRNEANNLPILIDAIANQSAPKQRFELILVDDGSTDNWQTTLPKMEGLNMTIVPNQGTGKKQAVRTGVEVAKGSVVLVTDADCTPGEHWITTMASYFIDNQPRLVIGPVMLAPAKGFFHLFQRTDFLSLQLSGAGAVLNGKPTMCNGANMAFTRNFYLSVPHLNPRYLSGDDIFLLHGAKQSQTPIHYALSQQAIVQTIPEPTYKQMWRQRIRWASKTNGYTDADTLLTAYTVATMNTMLPMLFITGFFAPMAWVLMAIAFGIKCAIDLQLFHYGRSFFGITITWAHYLAIQFLHPFHTVGTIVAAITTNVKWKDRKVISASTKEQQTVHQ
jgi:poly-beta-1,6-N-acetyl-D-glucosamine synthase